MGEVRPIDANDLLKHLNVTSITTESKKETMQYFISGIRQALNKIAIPSVQKAPTLGMEVFWKSADCPPPTHIDEWDDDNIHYRFDISDTVWLYCADGSQIEGRYENGSWYDNNGRQIIDTEHIRCTHWMPFPEAPKEVKA